MENKINKPELRSNFEEFALRMRKNWHIGSKPTSFCESLPFRPKLLGNNLWAKMFKRL